MTVTYLTLINKNLNPKKLKKRQGAKITQKEFRHCYKWKELIWTKLKI